MHGMHAPTHFKPQPKKDRLFRALGAHQIQIQTIEPTVPEPRVARTPSVVVVVVVVIVIVVVVVVVVIVIVVISHSHTPRSFV
jgi:hypothetical protein